MTTAALRPLAVPARPLAVSRLVVAAMLGAAAVLHPTDQPLLLAAATALLLIAAGMVLLPMQWAAHAWIAPSRLRPVALYAADAGAAYLVALAYPSPDPLSWLGFVALIVGGAARWTLNGAVFSYALYLAVDLPDVLGLASTGDSSTAVAGIRVGVMGLAALVIGLVAQMAAQFRALQARTEALDESRSALDMEATTHRQTAVRLQSLLDNVGDGIITFDESGVIESANRAAGLLVDRPAELLTRMHVDDLLAPAYRDGLDARLQRVPLEWEAEGLRRDGSTFPMEFRASEMHIGSTRLFIATLRDTSELKARTLALQHQALHDNLTGLPNRMLLADRLGQAISEATRTQRRVALLLMDMDGFKEVNDSLGHHSGDMLLRQVAARLRSALRDSDTVARLGGDEFAILPAGDCDEDSAMRIADKVLSALQAPFMIEEQAIHARMSIGLAVHPDHGDDAETLLRRADVAMYTAKRMRSGQVAYSPSQDEHSKRRLQLTGELRRAIPSSELVLHYQPRLDLASGEINALEALVRWQHPQHGLVPPSEFIPVAEQSDLIHPLTAWVAGEAVRQLREFGELGLDLSVAINLSARNLEDQQLPLMMAGLLRTWGVGASQLRLEMTESVVMASDWQHVLEQLHTLGLSVAIDDFGVGYSSLAYLQRLPVDEIKIDKSFVVDMVDNPDNAAIVRSTIELGHNLGLRVVAEGVETPACLGMLTSFGCDVAQGYLVSPPLSAADLIEFFAERRQRAAMVLPSRSA